MCVAHLPAGVVLPKISAAAEIIDAATCLADLERRLGASPGSTRLLVIATETPRGLLALPQYPLQLQAAPAAAARLLGITWGAEDLSAALGALGKRDSAGALTLTFQLARATCLLATSPRRSASRTPRSRRGSSASRRPWAVSPFSFR